MKNIKFIFAILLVCMRFASCGSKFESLKWSKELTTEVLSPEVYSSLNNEYERVSPFICDGLVCVYKNSRYGYVDKSGKLVVSCIYSMAEDFEDGCARVAKSVDSWSGEWGLIDTDGKEIVACQYHSIDKFIDGIAIASKEIDDEYKYGFINKKGEVIVPMNYDRVEEFSNDVALIVQNGKYGFVNEKGEEVVHCTYDFAFSFEEGSELATCQSGENIHCVDNEGNIVLSFNINASRYNTFDNFYEGFMIVAVYSEEKEKRIYGVIDEKGNEIVPCKYDAIEYFSDGLAVVRSEDKYGCINEKGELVIPCEIMGRIYGFTDGLSWVYEGFYYAIDKKGEVKIVLPKDMTPVTAFNDGRAIVKFRGNGTDYGFVDESGNIEIAFLGGEKDLEKMGEDMGFDVY